MSNAHRTDVLIVGAGLGGIAAHPVNHINRSFFISHQAIKSDPKLFCLSY